NRVGNILSVTQRHILFPGSQSAIQVPTCQPFSEKIRDRGVSSLTKRVYQNLIARWLQDQYSWTLLSGRLELLTSAVRPASKKADADDICDGRLLQESST
ncbi:hypothetical protein SERLA73DRAFT_182491, partial [Serpula lacrymans var. lacrymans S7.3]